MAQNIYLIGGSNDNKEIDIPSDLEQVEILVVDPDIKKINRCYNPSYNLPLKNQTERYELILICEPSGFRHTHFFKISTMSDNHALTIIQNRHF